VNQTVTMRTSQTVVMLQSVMCLLVDIEEDEDIVRIIFTLFIDFSEPLEYPN